MLLWGLVLLTLGVWLPKRWRSRSYWLFAIGTIIWIAAFPYLFYAGGTLDQPEGDGFITRHVRAAIGDNIAFGLFAIVALIAFYGVTIVLVSRAIKSPKSSEAPPDVT